ncbi:MAG: alpha/beta hydrolase [Roseateles depolymerans]|uniref:Alpha/beta hydrolase n=1 Tax=Roseateles depolymerans TaxID=76731 RepID=A0A2W5E0C9_9BURK|nr:MAG: alpha/beta hydrolase [Roseateles depolymerans]
MKKTALSAALTALLSACSQPLPLAPSQEASISPEAAAFIRRSRYTDLPAFIPISAGQILKARQQFDQSEDLPERALIQKFGLQVERQTLAGVPVLSIRPARVAPGLERTVALNIHGGGFVLGGPRDRSALLVAGTLGVPVISVDYTMAPEARFPVPIEQSLAVYRALVQQHGAEHLMGISSSAGGQIMLAMLLRAAQEGLPMMKAQVLFTPASDLSGAGDSAVANDGRDVVAAGPALRSVRQFYLGEADPKDPRVSPIYAQFPHDFPASVIVTGTRDLMLSNATRLFWKLRDRGVPAELLVTEGGWHGFHWEYDTPESQAALNASNAFLRRQLGDAPARQ